VSAARPLLARATTLDLPSLDGLEGDALGAVVRIWLGEDREPKGRAEVAAAVGAVRAVLADETAVRARLAALRPDVREVLATVARYAGSVDEELLENELVARGLTKRGRVKALNDPLKRALDARLLTRVGDPRRSLLPDARDEIVLPRALLAHVAPAKPVGWASLQKSTPTPQRTFSRPTRAFDLAAAEVARAVTALGDVTTTAGRLSAASRKDIEGLLPPIVSDDDLVKPPARIALAWHVLLALDVAQDQGNVGTIDHARYEAMLAASRATRDEAWVAAWMRAEQWQDGIGATADPTTRRDSIGAPPPSPTRTRRLIAWALSRIASDEPRWLEIEQFLVDFHRATGGQPQWVQGPFALRVPLSHAEEHREIAPWLTGPGQLVANVVLVTLVHLGMIERGELGGGRWCFRLTPAGRAVFGAPEGAVLGGAATTPRRSLRFGADLEIAVDVNEIDVGELAALDRFARRVGAGAHELLYRLDRASVYAGLEAGLSREAIEGFLAVRSRTELPTAISAALGEWAAGREAVRIRPRVTLVVDVLGARDTHELEAATFAAAYALSTARPTPGVRMDEQLAIEVPRAIDPITDARLARIADRNWAGFQITEASLRRAAAAGIDANQALRWLDEAMPGGVPALARVAVRALIVGGVRAMLQEHVAIRVEDPAIEQAIGESESLHAMGLRWLGPGWLLCERSRVEEVVARLGELGVLAESAARKRTMTMGPSGGGRTTRRKL
jgi:hypothetical protein